MVTLSGFRRRLYSGDSERDVELPAGMTGWLPAQQHAGENIGDTATEVVFIELKDGGPAQANTGALGPQEPSCPPTAFCAHAAGQDCAPQSPGQSLNPQIRTRP